MMTLHAMQRTTCTLWLAAMLTGCTRESAGPAGTNIEPFSGRIVINEVSVNGDDGDRIELYNPGPVITLEEGAWYLSDDATDPFRFELPSMELEEGGFVVVQCVGDEFEGDELTAPFGLNGHEAGLVLSVLQGERSMTIDRTGPLPETPGNTSLGRIPDGSGQWARLSPSTLGGPNEAAPER